VSVATGTGAGDSQADDPAAPQAGAQPGGQEPPAATGQEPAAGAQAGAAGGNGAAPDGETPEAKAARLERELADARKEAASYRTKAAKLEGDQRAAAQAGMSEAEKAAERTKELERQNAELTASLREQALQSAAYAVAMKLNYRSPELAYRLLDRADLEFEDDGRPKNVEKLLQELAKRETYLVKAAGQDYGGGNRGAQPDGQPGMNELLRAALGKG
jgi:hypothetical protein